MRSPPATTSVADAVEAMRGLPFEPVPDANVDHHRELRTGHPEAIYGPGKTDDQVRDIALALAARASGAVLLTRATPAQTAVVLAAVPGAVVARPRRPGGGEAGPRPAGGDRGRGGGRDRGPARRRRGRVLAGGRGGPRDAGSPTWAWPACTGSWHRRSELDAADCCVVVAGMEGALPSVVAGPHVHTRSSPCPPAWATAHRSRASRRCCRCCRRARRACRSSTSTTGSRRRRSAFRIVRRLAAARRQPPPTDRV